MGFETWVPSSTMSYLDIHSRIVNDLAGQVDCLFLAGLCPRSIRDRLPRARRN